MKRIGRAAKCAALLVAGFFCFGYSSGALRAAGALVQKRDGAERYAASPEATGAKTLFEQKCARCHGRDGQGETTIGRLVGAPDFTDAGWWQERRSNAALVESVTKGKGGMPAFGKKLTQKEIASLVAYARSFKK